MIFQVALRHDSELIQSGVLFCRKAYLLVDLQTIAQNFANIKGIF